MKLLAIARRSFLSGSFLLLIACATSEVARTTRAMLDSGNYKSALETIDQAVARRPESIELRTLQRTIREEVSVRLISQANAERSAGRQDAAESTLRRLLALEPGNERAQSLLVELDRERRTRAAEDEAARLAREGKARAALTVVEEALKDNPRSAGLLKLQRDLELGIRRQAENSTGGLANTSPISLEFRDANVRMIFEALSRTTGVNFIVDKDVRADLQTTIFLKQARLEDALTVITGSTQLAMRILNPTTVLIYSNTPEKAREYQDLLIRGFYLANADAKTTGNLLKTMLKLREVFVDDKLNLVVVRDTPEAVRLAERLVAMHDLGEPEVMLEVEVLEVKTTRLLELGIRYPDSFTLTPLSPRPGGQLTLDDLRNLNSSTIGVTTPSITLNFKREVGDLNVLANPKIRARNREKARILIGDKLPVITSTATSTGFVSENVQYVDVGIKLEVEPNVYFDDDVAIRVALEVSNLVREVRTSTGTLAYQIGTRSASTTLRLKDGETQLLAGLLSNAERSDGARIPGLGDIRGLNRVFGSQRDSSEKTEIVLSITPRLIRPARMPDANLNEFWSGTDGSLRLRPFGLPQVDAGEPALASALQSDRPDSSRGSGGARQPAGAERAAFRAMEPVRRAPTRVVAELSAPGRTKSGETIVVDLRLSSDGGVRALPLQVKVDPQKFEIVEVSEGGFFKQSGGTTSFSKTVDKNDGRVQAVPQRTDADGAAGEGVVLSLRLKALSPGTSSIEIVSASALGIEGVDAAVTLPQPVSVVID
jgi:general secretion pathway protein D